MSQYKTEIGVSSLTAGTYILRYVHNNGVGVKTFIKK
ncbi:MAG: T9SS type A sorting domain-containing protein [Bacteroidaceae bacterium]|nr:T9SS type A sorting domain-containing protein [Bacteroidaceae bacterium]